MDTAAKKINFFNLSRTGMFVVAMVAAVLGVNIGPGVGVASAVSLSDCHKITNPKQSVWYAYMPEYLDYYSWTENTFTVPNTSACHDINIGNIKKYSGTIANNGCGWFRVRFYPSSGTDYVNDWQWRCSGTTDTIATNVLNGTKYRVELFPLQSNNMSQQAFSFNLWD
jgi:hypothetical protein